MAIYSSDPAVTSGETVYDVTPEEDSGSNNDDPADTSSSSSSSSTSTSTRTGGEKTYDVDDSVDEDPSLDYSSINDPRQTDSDTTGTAGGEGETSEQQSGWGGGIAGGLDPSGPDSDGDGISDSEEEQIRSITQTTHTTNEDGDRVHTTDRIPDDPRYIFFDDGDPSTDSGGATEPDWSGDGNPGGNATDRVPNVEVPEIPTPEFEFELGGGWLAAGAIALLALAVGGSAAVSGGGS